MWLTARLDRGEPTVARAQKAGRRTVAEESGRHDVGLVSLSSERASVQISTATRRTRLPGRPAASRDAIDRPDTPPRAAETEHRNALDVVAKPHPPGDARLDARRGDAGRGDGHHGVDVAGRETPAASSAFRAASTKRSDAASR